MIFETNEMNWELDYGELSQDKDLVDAYENVKENLMEVQKVLDKLLPLKAHYDKMSLPAKIEYDLYLVYTLNSLQWIDLRLQGIDPNTTQMKHELQRIKAAMARWQELKDREKRPKVNIEAAKRFIKSGLYDPYRGTGQPPNKKIKFEDDNE